MATEQQISTKVYDVTVQYLYGTRSTRTKRVVVPAGEHETQRAANDAIAWIYGRGAYLKADGSGPSRGQILRGIGSCTERALTYRVRVDVEPSECSYTECKHHAQTIDTDGLPVCCTCKMTHTTAA